MLLDKTTTSTAIARARGSLRRLSRYAHVVEPGRTIIRTTTISQARVNRPVNIDTRGSRAIRDSTEVDVWSGLSSWVTALSWVPSTAMPSRRPPL